MALWGGRAPAKSRRVGKTANPVRITIEITDPTTYDTCWTSNPYGKLGRTSPTWLRPGSQTQQRVLDARRLSHAVMSPWRAAQRETIDPGFMPRDGEWVRQGGPDKFLGSNLEEKLKARGIKTVIVCGTSFQGVGIGTGSGAAQRGYKVIVPIDCLSAEDTYMEQYAAWHLYKGGPAVVTSQVTLTRSTMVKF